MTAPSLDIMLRALRLPSVLARYRDLASTATANNWGFEQYLHTLLEVEHRRPQSAANDASLEAIGLARRQNAR